ncbi:unnamed protein product [Lota lota]
MEPAWRRLRSQPGWDPRDPIPEILIATAIRKRPRTAASAAHWLLLGQGVRLPGETDSPPAELPEAFDAFPPVRKHKGQRAASGFLPTPPQA